MSKDEKKLEHLVGKIMRLTRMMSTPYYKRAPKNHQHIRGIKIEMMNCIKGLEKRMTILDEMNQKEVRRLIVRATMSLK